MKQKKNLPYIIFLIKNFNKKMAARVFFSAASDFVSLLEIPAKLLIVT
jgi:hypothetical protein